MNWQILKAWSQKYFHHKILWEEQNSNGAEITVVFTYSDLSKIIVRKIMEVWKFLELVERNKRNDPQLKNISELHIFQTGALFYTSMLDIHYGINFLF